MKKAVFYYCCHAGPITHHLQQSPTIKHNYSISHININDYQGTNKYNNCADFIEEHKREFAEADILLCLYIRNDRGFMHHNNVLSLCKKQVKIIILPFYSASLYFYYDHIRSPINAIKSTNMKAYHEELRKIIDETSVDPLKIQEHLEKEFSHLSALDATSTIKMLDTVKQNYTKDRLWWSRSYPSSKFFYYMAQRILDYLQIDSNIPFIDDHFMETITVPIIPSVYNSLKLQFTTDTPGCPYSMHEFYCIRHKLNLSIEDDSKLFPLINIQLPILLPLIRKETE